ncbi:Bax inhibitor-1 family protein [Camelliibacillus cellulosilyticus]|uniref:Bax inhibitor-1 family protein n=1 Tax=Camelliibacillus cellulosilyticus TaxID=2174486 RepID=A0ABV9GP33_9BACL
MENTYVHATPERPYAKFFAMLFMALLAAAVGMYAGQYVPRGLFLPLTIVYIAMVFMMFWARKRKAIGYGMMFAFTFVSGLILYPAIFNYVSVLGAGVVLRAAGITAFAFGGTALYAVVSKRDFRFLGGFLFVSIIALIGMGILQIFFPLSGTAQLVLSGFGIFVFIGYTLFDFSRLTHDGFTDSDIPLLVVCIYLDIINLFLYILQFIGVLSRD